MFLQNLTPHPLVFKTEEGGELTVQPAGFLARCEEFSSPTGEITVDGVAIPVISKAFGEIEGLPNPVRGTIYVVSALAAQAAWRAGRVADVFCPGDPIRDAEGKIVGCRSLCASPDYKG